MTSDATLRDQRARDDAATEIRANAFIEAGAGTGKSTTLVSRIVRTIVAPSAVPITSIAAITFTERAGAELRHRIRERIVDRIAHGTDSASDLALLSVALRDLDAAPIGTIHAFAQRILRTHCLSAGLPLAFAPAAGSDAADDALARIHACVDALQERLDPHATAVLAAYGLAPADLVPALRALDAEWLRLEDSAFVGPVVDVGALCANVADAFEDFLHEARADCADDADRLMAKLEEVIPPVVEVLRRADPIELASQATDPDGIASIFKVGSVGAQKGWGPGGAKARRDAFKDLAPALTACLRAPLDTAVRTAFAEAWDVMRVQRDLRARQGVVTFDELLSRARDLVRDDPEVRALVHAEYPVVLVDEFQDTDPVQWELVRLITADPTDVTTGPLPGRLVVVGDPKQAIYSFRGADVHTYAGALEAFTSARRPLGLVFELTTNFRSVAPLIDWVNRVFDAAMARNDEQVPYRPLDIRHQPSASAPGPAVTVIRDPEQPESADGTRATGVVDSRVLEPRLVAQEITRAVRDGWLITEPAQDRSRHYTRPVTFSDIAVLYPARTGVPALLDALDDADVPYRSGDAGLVFARPVVLGLRSALAVLDDPSRELDLWLTLKSPLFGCTDVDLLDYRTAGGTWRLGADPVGRDGQAITGPVAEALAILHRARRGLPAPEPAAAIDRLLADTRILEALAATPRGAFDADCVRMLRAHAQRFGDDGGIGLPDYLAEIDGAMSDSTRSSLPEPDVRDDNAVRLMTVHQAKGLEFPVVALAGMANAMHSPAPTIGVVARDRYEFDLGRGLRSVRYEEWDGGTRRPRDLAERARLLYVACTRARDHLIVSVCGEHGSTAKAHASLLWDAVARTAGDVCALDVPSVAVASTALPGLPALPDDWHDRVDRVRARSGAPFVAAPSGAATRYLGLGEPVAGTRPDRPIDTDPSFDTSVARTALAARDGRPLGRAVHAALDRLVRVGPAARRADIDEACTAAALAEGIASQIDQVATRVRAALATDLMAQALAADRRWTELYLAAPVDVDGVRLVEGFADLLFETADGLVLVDYKTDESISDQARAHYAEQLAAYAELVRRATGRDVVARRILHLSADDASVIDV